MADYDDLAYWRAEEQRSKDKRAMNRAASPKYLERQGIKFESRNEGAHLIVDGRVDFWPGTGLWIVKEGNKRGRGVKHLANWIKNTQPPADESADGCAIPAEHNPSFKEVS